jgi:hypothetical protein
MEQIANGFSSVGAVASVPQNSALRQAAVSFLVFLDRIKLIASAD